MIDNRRRFRLVVDILKSSSEFGLWLRQIGTNLTQVLVLRFRVSRQADIGDYRSQKLQRRSTVEVVPNGISDSDGEARLVMESWPVEIMVPCLFPIGPIE